MRILIIVIPIKIIRRWFPTAEQKLFSREELAALADIGEAEKSIDEDEEKVIMNLLKLREMLVSDVMTPSVVMDTVSSAWSVDTALRKMPIMIHGRIPVIGESIDEVLGIILREVISETAAAADEDDILMSEIMRPAIFCDQSESVDVALDILLDKKEQIMIVQDEFGGTRGLLTMEDIIETLLGVEIVDEHLVTGMRLKKEPLVKIYAKFTKEKFGALDVENIEQDDRNEVKDK